MNYLLFAVFTVNGKKIKYKSKFNSWLIFIHALVAIGALIIGFNFMQNGALLGRALGTFFLLFSIVLVIELIKLKQVYTDRDSLVFEYPFLFTSISLPWNSIIKIDKHLVTTKTDAIDSSFSTGRTLQMQTNSNKYILTSFYYRNFDKFQIELNKRVDSSIKDSMRIPFNSEQKLFWQEERKLKRLTRYIIPIALTVLMIIWLIK